MPNAQESTLMLALDLAGTFAFGLSGGLVGVRARLDLFGIIVLAAVVGLVGGITRDILLGALPPATFSDWRYLAAAAAAGLVTFFVRPTLERFSRPVGIFDAAGLSLFCVTGATKALAFDVGAVQAVLLGVITAIGGGMLRDVLVREIPMVLRSELYAIPALVGATIVVAASKFGHHGAATAILAAAVCFLIRIVGMRFDLGLPTAPSERHKEREHPDE
jgi:uncharacterized membrane protein YeiH